MELFDPARYQGVRSDSDRCPACGARGDLVAYGRVGSSSAPSAALLGGRSVGSGAPDRVCRDCRLAWLAPLRSGRRWRRRRFLLFGRLC